MKIFSKMENFKKFIIYKIFSKIKIIKISIYNEAKFIFKKFFLKNLSILKIKIQKNFQKIFKNKKIRIFGF